ncbi:hypothetical protein [Stieleria varia]|uniref:hypothetical protein n=1 Tax=Stieleria varia TaxID=2528005 RepID=UPI0011B6A6AA|nr:hypothetical protein [Stieleria varia]
MTSSSSIQSRCSALIGFQLQTDQAHQSSMHSHHDEIGTNQQVQPPRRDRFESLRVIASSAIEPTKSKKPRRSPKSHWAISATS